MKDFLTSQKIPEYPVGQLQVTVFPSSSTHWPPCWQGALSQGLGPFWQYFPEKPGGHKHLDPDIWSYMGQHILCVIYIYICDTDGASGKGALQRKRGGLLWICLRQWNILVPLENKYCSQLEAKCRKGFLSTKKTWNALGINTIKMVPMDSL